MSERFGVALDPAPRGPELEADGPVAEYRRVLDELKERAAAAARRGDPMRWAFHLETARRLRSEFASVTVDDDGYAGAALAVSQNAEWRCPLLPPMEAALEWAVGAQARRILAAWKAGREVVSLDWLRFRESEAA